MEISNNLQERITQIALVIFAVLLTLIIYVFFSPSTKNAAINQAKNTDTIQQNNPITTPKAVVSEQNHTAAAKAVVSENQPAVSTPKVQQTEAKQITKTTQDKVEIMKLDNYKVPNNNKPKLSEFIPEELKSNIQKSLLTPEQIQALSPEERLKYQETQRKLAAVLRRLGQMEAENQKLQNSLAQAEQQKQQLDYKVQQLQMKQ